MTDQNTAQIIAAFIGGAATLIVALFAFIGGFISNHSTTKLEKLKIREEKRNRDASIIREICEIFAKTDYLVDTFSYEVREKMRLDPLEKAKEIQRSSMGAKVLIRIYLPHLLTRIEEYENALYSCYNAIGVLYLGKKGELRNPVQEREEHDRYKKAYKDSLENLLIELEKLVK